MKAGRRIWNYFQACASFGMVIMSLVNMISLLWRTGEPPSNGWRFWIWRGQRRGGRSWEHWFTRIWRLQWLREKHKWFQCYFLIALPCSKFELIDWVGSLQEPRLGGNTKKRPWCHLCRWKYTYWPLALRERSPIQSLLPLLRDSWWLWHLGISKLLAAPCWYFH